MSRDEKQSDVIISATEKLSLLSSPFAKPLALQLIQVQRVILQFNNHDAWNFSAITLVLDQIEEVQADFTKLSDNFLENSKIETFLELNERQRHEEYTSEACEILSKLCFQEALDVIKGAFDIARAVWMEYQISQYICQAQRCLNQGVYDAETIARFEIQMEEIKVVMARMPKPWVDELELRVFPGIEMKRESGQKAGFAQLMALSEERLSQLKQLPRPAQSSDNDEIAMTDDKTLGPTKTERAIALTQLIKLIDCLKRIEALNKKLPMPTLFWVVKSDKYSVLKEMSHELSMIEVAINSLSPVVTQMDVNGLVDINRIVNSSRDKYPRLAWRLEKWVEQEQNLSEALADVRLYLRVEGVALVPRKIPRCHAEFIPPGTKQTPFSDRQEIDINEQLQLAATRLIRAIARIEKTKSLAEGQFVFLRYQLFKAAKKAFITLDTYTQKRFGVPDTKALIRQLPSKVRKGVPLSAIHMSHLDEATIQLCQQFLPMNLEQAHAYVKKEFKATIIQSRKARDVISHHERTAIRKRQADSEQARREIIKAGFDLLTLFDCLNKKHWITPSRFSDIEAGFQTVEMIIEKHPNLAATTIIEFDEKSSQFQHLQAVFPAMTHYLLSFEKLTITNIGYRVKELIRTTRIGYERDAQATAEKVLWAVKDLTGKTEIIMLVTDKDISQDEHHSSLQDEKRQTELINTVKNAFETVVDHKTYQALAPSDRKTIIELIARELFFQCNNCDTTTVHYHYDQACDGTSPPVRSFKTEKGFHYNTYECYETDGEPERTTIYATSVCFPSALFLNSEKLQLIIENVVRTYPILNPAYKSKALAESLEEHKSQVGDGDKEATLILLSGVSKSPIVTTATSMDDHVDEESIPPAPTSPLQKSRTIKLYPGAM